MHVDGSMSGAYSTMSGILVASSRMRRIAINGTIGPWRIGKRKGERDYLAKYA
jgi:hypothetical protein